MTKSLSAMPELVSNSLWRGDIGNHKIISVSDTSNLGSEVLWYPSRVGWHLQDHIDITNNLIYVFGLISCLFCFGTKGSRKDTKGTFKLNLIIRLK